MALLGGGHQGRSIAAVELVGADQQVHATDPETLQGVDLASGCTHQWPDAIKQLGEAADQQPVAAGHHGAALVKQRLAASRKRPHQRQLAGEVHAGSSGLLVEPCAWRESALPRTT